MDNTLSDNYTYINLPSNHLSYYFNRHPAIADKCLKDDECTYREFLRSESYKRDVCWGYESECKKENAYSKPRCPGKNLSYIKDKQTQIDTFYAQADFGYVKQQIDEMTIMCEPLFPTDSSLECSKYLRFCRGRNLMLNFTDLIKRKEPLRYKMDVLKQGEIGGYCKIYKDRLKREGEHVSALQSWAPELRFFEELPYRPIEEKKCDIVIDKPTYIMKIDASSNMYHHFCDFFNLYASLHVNQTHPFAFRTDVHVLVWESFTYESAFSDAFKAFTDNPIWDLKTFAGDVVCFKNVVLPLLPRMIFGLYYNTPIIQGCENSGLFQAFSEHILHRLRIPYHKRESPKIRITFLVRRTKYRQILNEEELFKEISEEDGYFVRKISFGRGIPFIEQLEIMRNTDVLIGMHGAGLTHLLFLPNWGTIFELYNCEDPNCYKDLARLRGVNYITWENKSKVIPEDEGHHPEGGAHAKFTNYTFDKKEFARLVRKAADHVRNHEEFKKQLPLEAGGGQHHEL